jgi:hypothetical protein
LLNNSGFLLLCTSKTLFFTSSVQPVNLRAIGVKIQWFLFPLFLFWFGEVVRDKSTLAGFGLDMTKMTI